MSVPPRVALRPAAAGDAEALWRWRNDPVTRGASYDEREVPLDVHTRWFEEALGRPDRRILREGAGKEGEGRGKQAGNETHLFMIPSRAPSSPKVDAKAGGCSGTQAFTAARPAAYSL